MCGADCSVPVGANSVARHIVSGLCPEVDFYAPIPKYSSRKGEDNIRMGSLHLESCETVCNLWTIRLAGVHEKLTGDLTLNRLRVTALADVDHLVETDAFCDDTEVNLHGTTYFGLDESGAVENLIS